ncbi:MAG: acetyl-CoA carboxylase carboxyl transferase subunit beta, partial [Pelagibacterales bacterium]|nr:acetyl-CoA carboxylase carboxyl transferase subunit beta [Pelagibacterales bacterium]
MNWIKKTLNIGEKIKTLLKNRPTKQDIASSDWISCCKGPILKKDLKNNLWVCSSCRKHHRINCRQRFDIFFGKNNYEILNTPIPLDDPLEWIDSKTYKERLKEARKKTGQESAVLIVKGKINKIDVTVGAIDFSFIGGSVGAAEGEAIIYGIQHSIDNKTPFIFFPSGGGQRMFESPIALSQMTRTTLAVNELKKNNLPYIICFTDPTAGGITASFAMLGDLSLAEPGALIAFAGKRVIQATVKEELPENFQRSEHLHKCGFIDLIV